MSKRGNPNLVAGVSGNPAGRPLGSRNRLTHALVADLTASWEKHGPAVLERLRIDDPATYARLAASLVPKEMNVAVEKVDPILEKLDADARDALRELLTIIAGARTEGREPAEIFAAIAEGLNGWLATPVLESESGHEIGVTVSKALAVAPANDDEEESHQ
jgi:hypothetical protein